MTEEVEFDVILTFPTRMPLPTLAGDRPAATLIGCASARLHRAPTCGPDAAAISLSRVTAPISGRTHAELSWTPLHQQPPTAFFWIPHLESISQLVGRAIEFDTFPRPESLAHCVSPRVRAARALSPESRQHSTASWVPAKSPLHGSGTETLPNGGHTLSDPSDALTLSAVAKPVE